MSNSQPWDIQDDSDLKAAVRDETDYDSSTLPATDADGTDLDGLIQSGKRVLALQADVTDFYGDRGIAVALLGIVAAKAKASVENSPLQVKNVSGQDVTFRTSDGDSLQVSEYEEMTQLGLSESDVTDDAIQNIRFTNDYLSDSAGEW
jgi:hypothetical protein